MKAGWEHWQRLAEAEVGRTLARLPGRLRAEAETVPVTYQARPSRALRRDGIMPDTMGLFAGPPFGEESTAGTDVPPQIMLFLDVIREEAGGDAAVFTREVRTTYLHELGHYLGLDEDGLEARELG